MSGPALNILLEFSGGAELLFGNKKRHEVCLESSTKCKPSRIDFDWMIKFYYSTFFEIIFL